MRAARPQAADARRGARRKFHHYWAEKCGQCERPLPTTDAARVEVGEPERHPIIEMPKPKPHVEEHVLHAQGRLRRRLISHEGPIRKGLP